ncbi:hypothetical protein ACTG9Q_15980 [Actinokineospora sp. 24-640]
MTAAGAEGAVAVQESEGSVGKFADVGVGGEAGVQGEGGADLVPGA